MRKNETVNRSKSVTALFILLTAFLGPFAADIYVPSLPLMTQEFHTSNDVMRNTITLYLFGFCFFQLVYGPVSDRFGRKPVLITGLSICFIGTFICMTAHSITALLCGRFIQGLGMAGIISLIRSMMCDTFKGEQFASIMAYFGVIFSISFALAPILGGYLEQYMGWRASFLFLLCYVGCLWLATVFYFQETNNQLDYEAIHIKKLIANYKTMIMNKAFVGYVLVSGLTVATIIAYASLSPFLFENILHLTPVAYGWLAIVIAIGMVLSKFINANVVSRYGIVRMVLIGASTMLFSSVLMLALGLLHYLNVMVIMLPLLGVMIGGGFITPSAVVGAFTPFAKMAGTAGALFGALQITVVFVASALVAHLKIVNQIPLAVSFLVISILIFGIYRYLLNERRIS